MPEEWPYPAYQGLWVKLLKRDLRISRKMLLCLACQQGILSLLHLHDLTEILHCPLLFPCLFQEDTKTESDLRIPGVQGNGLLIGMYRLLHPPLLCVEHTQVKVGQVVITPQFDRS